MLRACISTRVIFVNEEKREEMVSMGEIRNENEEIRGRREFAAESEFLFIVGRKDISLHLSWHDFEAGVAKCTGNDGP